MSLVREESVGNAEAKRYATGKKDIQAGKKPSENYCRKYCVQGTDALAVGSLACFRASV